MQRPWIKDCTVNVVIFWCGKISQKCWQDMSCRVNFHDTTLISFIKAYGFYFREEDKSAKNAKINPTQKFPRLRYTKYCLPDSYYLTLIENFIAFPELGWTFLPFSPVSASLLAASTAVWISSTHSSASSSPEPWEMKMISVRVWHKEAGAQNTDVYSGN